MGERHDFGEVPGQRADEPHVLEVTDLAGDRADPQVVAVDHHRAGVLFDRCGADRGAVDVVHVELVVPDRRDELAVRRERQHARVPRALDRADRLAVGLDEVDVEVAVDEAAGGPFRVAPRRPEVPVEQPLGHRRQIDDAPVVVVVVEDPAAGGVDDRLGRFLRAGAKLAAARAVEPVHGERIALDERDLVGAGAPVCLEHRRVDRDGRLDARACEIGDRDRPLADDDHAVAGRELEVAGRAGVDREVEDGLAVRREDVQVALEVARTRTGVRRSPALAGCRSAHVGALPPAAAIGVRDHPGGARAYQWSRAGAPRRSRRARGARDRR